MKYLIETVETYRINNESQVEQFIEEAKKDNHFSLKKYVSQYKEVKSKGEVIDFYWKVTLTKTFTNEKEPSCETEIKYTNETESAF